MNEQMQSAVATMIEKATSGVEAGIDFLSAEITDVIHQLLMWKMVESLTFFGIGVVILIAAFWSIGANSRLINKAKADHANGELWTFFSDRKLNTSSAYDAIVSGVGYWGSGFALAIGFITVIVNRDWLQIWIAPKVYLIEYAASLAK